jgi:hypothetical protein
MEIRHSRPEKLAVLVLAALLPLAHPIRSYAQGYVLPRDAGRTIVMSTWKGKTLLDSMTASGTGIYDRNKADNTAAVAIVASADIMTDLSKFDPQISSKAAALFTNGKSDLSAIFGHLQGKMVTPQNIRTALTPLIQDLKTASDKSLAVDVLADIALLGSGSGTLVDLGGNNYFYNIGYTVPVVKSGRSYAVSPSRPLLDPSDTYYLSEMDSVLGSSHPGAPDSFLGVALNVLLNCDSSGVSSLDSTAQTALIDFVAVYTAELDRHVMVNLVPSKDPWEIDIAEVTLVSSYGSAAKMVMKNGSLVAGSATAYYGTGTSGGGIGETRADFMKLGTAITTYESLPGNHPDLVNNLMGLTPISSKTLLGQLKGDLFRRFLVYLNNPANQAAIEMHPNDYSAAMSAFLKQIRSDQSAITAYVKSH